MSEKDRRARGPRGDGSEGSVGPEADAYEGPPETAPDAESNGPETTTTTGAPDAEARVEELEDRVKRLQAEFLNETKRIQRQADERRKYAVEGLVGDLLPVFDALHSAREGLVASAAGEAAGGADAVRQGLDLVEKEFLSVLGRHGVERIEATDAPFDPNLHEAVFVVDDATREPNLVAQVLRPGFTLSGRVVRPAHVAVTRRPDGAGGDA